MNPSVLENRRDQVLVWSVTVVGCLSAGWLLSVAPAEAIGGLAVALFIALVIARNIDVLIPMASLGLVLGSSTVPGTDWFFGVKFVILGSIGLLAFVPSLRPSIQRPAPNLFRSLLGGLVLVAFISAIYSTSPPTTLLHASSLLLLWLAVAVTVPRFLRNVERVETWLAHVGVVAALAVVAGILLTAGGFVEGFQGGRFRGLFVDPNTLGYYVAPILPGLVLLSVRPGRGGRAWLLGSVAIIAVGLALSGSRAGVLSSVLGVMSAIWVARMARQTRMRRRALAAVLIGVAATSVLLVSINRPVRPPGPEGFVTNLGTGSYRTIAWSRAIPLIVDDPFRGTGFATTAELFTAHDLGGGIVFGHLHNSYLETALDTGLPAVGVLLLLIGSGLFAAWRVSTRSDPVRSLGPILFGGILGGSIEGVFESGLLSAGGLLAFHFWLMVAIAHTIERRTRKPWTSAGSSLVGLTA